ncbi:MAG TPA: DUF433 domain-containing protein [Bdellovibrionota bacterium]|nr:DUF433 domain-containing protein [Bdellovibrionota bacterium]
MAPDVNKWIVADPAICDGKPCVKGTRIPVDLLLDKLAAGESFEQVLEAHPRLTDEALKAAIAFASQNLKADLVYPVEQKVRG